MTDQTTTLTGGCQCGRVRYSVALATNQAYYCHCNMCKRSTGGIAAAFVGVKDEQLTWESQPDWYASWPVARRPFCATCGTPLGFRFNEGTGMDLTVGSFDNPGWFVPTEHAGAESLIEAWLDTSALPRSRTDENQSVIDAYRKVGREVP
jgi:hypothetical protein